MKTRKRNKLLSLALTGSFSLFGASGVYAAANDLISNIATLNYDVGTVTQTPIESSGGAGNSIPGVGNGVNTDFREDRVVNFTVVRDAGPAQVVPGGTQQAVPFLVDNTGNGTHGFLLAGVHNLGAINPFNAAENDIYTPTTIETYVDSNDNGTLDPAEIAAGNSFIASLTPAAAAVRVFVVSNIPLDDRTATPLVNGDVAVVSLVAQAAETVPGSGSGATTGIAADAIVLDDNGNVSVGGTFTNGTAVVADETGNGVSIADDPANMETVFNDTATTDAVTGATVDARNNPDTDQNAQQSAYSAYVIQSAALTVTKTSSALWDFINLNSDPKSIPGGSVIRYSVTIANAAGAAAATLTTIEDVLPLVLDTQFGDGTAANGPVSGVNNVRVTPPVGAPVFCQADNGDANTDGCQDNGGAGSDALVVDFSVLAAGAAATLNAGQSLTIEFDVILP